MNRETSLLRRTPEELKAELDKLGRTDDQKLLDQRRRIEKAYTEVSRRTEERKKAMEADTTVLRGFVVLFPSFDIALLARLTIYIIFELDSFLV